MDSGIYLQAQRAIAELKAAVRDALAKAPATGLTNAELGHMLGIYSGHVGHEGHIPRTLLAMLESEGIAVQDPATKRWTLRTMFESTSDTEK